AGDAFNLVLRMSYCVCRIAYCVKGYRCGIQEVTYEVELGQPDYDSSDTADSSVCQLYAEDKRY
ncbi:unnamed protein product, partial [marine sediment metagenome]